MLYPHVKFGGDLKPRGGERGKNVCFLFVFLFVTLTVCVSLDYRRALCEGYIVAIYRSILMQFSTFLEEKTPCRIFQKYLNYITRWRHICLGIRSKFRNFSKFERQSLCTRLRHICLGITSKFGNLSKFERQSLCTRLGPFRRRLEKIPSQPISAGIVDMHLYKNNVKN